MKYHISLEPVLRINMLNTCSLFRASHPYNFHREFHPFWELVYVVEGTLRVACQERVYTLKQGDLVLHRPMELHRLWSVEDHSFRVLVVGFCAEGPLLSQLKSTAFELNLNQQTQINNLILQLQKNFPDTKYQFLQHASQAQEAYAPQLQMFANALEIFLISLLHQPDLPQPKPQSLSQSALLYGRIVDALNGSPDGWITAGEIAEKLHCSESQVKQTFARYSDMGIHKYLLKLKTAAAIQLLQQGCSVNEVSRQLGFANQNYFSTVFKRETGLPPSRYTKEIAEL
jgi:AraC-like DNA-binding protein